MSHSGPHESSNEPIERDNSKKKNERDLPTIPSGITVDGRSLHGDSRKGNKCEEEDSKNSFDLKNPMDIPSEKPPSSPSSSSSKNGTSDSFVVGQEVHLLSPVEINIRVARGRVAAVCPTDKVGGAKLGKNFVGVCVEEIFVPDEDLTRPYADYSIIGEAEGATIAWQRTCLQHI